MTREQRDLIRQARDGAVRQRLRQRGENRVRNVATFAEGCFDASGGDPLAALARAVDMLCDPRRKALAG